VFVWETFQEGGERKTQKRESYEESISNLGWEDGGGGRTPVVSSEIGRKEKGLTHALHR